MSLLFSVAAADPLEMDGGEGGSCLARAGGSCWLPAEGGPLNPGEAQPPNFRSALH